MSRRSRVVWNEGLLLTPQHMQQLERYHEERDGELFRASRPYAYGFTALDLDEDAIENGRVVIRSAAGVTESGFPFSFPDRDAVPSPRDLGKFFTVELNVLPVYVGIRIHRSGEREVAAEGNGLSDIRYLPGSVRLYDETSGDVERPVEVAHQNLRILFPSENLGDYDRVQVGEIVRTPEGKFAYRDTYAPPCLRVGASPVLMKALNQILEMMVARSKTLSDRRQHRGQGVAEFGRDDAAGFWLLGLVNSHIPVLTHYLRTGHAHPELVYRTVASLAGAMTTMSDLDVRDTPPYDHEKLGETFGGLIARIPKMMREVLPQNYERIPFTPRDQYVQIAALNDDRLIPPNVGFYLGVSANMAQQELQARFPDLVKIGPPDQVDFLISQAIRGVELKHIPTLPPSLPVQSNFVYFRVEKSGDVWDLVAGARSLAVYVPPEVPGYNLELIALKG